MTTDIRAALDRLILECENAIKQIKKRFTMHIMRDREREAAARREMDRINCEIEMVADLKARGLEEYPARVQSWAGWRDF